MHINEASQKILVPVALVVLAVFSFQGASARGRAELEPATDSVEVIQVVVSGNKITRPRVILNELEFKKGDTLAWDQLGRVITRSRENLLNTSLFNFVYIDYAIQKNGGLVFQIKVDERWYWWVFPIFEYADRNLSSFLNNGDWSRVNYGIYIKRDNFRGRKELLKFRLRLGFTSQLAMRFDSPEYKRKTGWGFEIDLKTNNSLPVYTYGNQQVFSPPNQEIIQYHYHSSVNYGWRPSLYQRHQITLSHTAVSVADTIVQLNPHYLSEGSRSMQYFLLAYQYQYDKRDSRIYTLKGTYLQLQLNQLGLGLLSDGLSDLSLKLRFQQAAPLAPKWHWSSTLEGRVGTNKSLPYFINQGIGYKSYMNGYELYVMDGAINSMLQNKLIFTLMEPRVKTLGFVPLTQFAKIHYAFYLKVFFDCGYVWQDMPDVSNDLVNQWQYGYGAGLDLVTFYDKVLSFNYSMNKLGQHGFFVHLNLDL